MKEALSVAFVCLHASAKSLIAAEVPSNDIEGLLRRSFDARWRVSERVSARALAQATHIVSFGCDLGDFVGERAVERWEDCPAVSDDFDVAFAFITGRVEALFERSRDAAREPQKVEAVR